MEVIENKDSSEFDICQVTQKTLRELHKICQFIPYAEGFNSAGWIKYHIRHNNLNQTNGSKLYVVRRPPEKMAAKSPLPKTFCINLERRPDRKDVMIERFNKANLDVEFVKAVDGRELAWTEELKHLFRNNTYGSHRGVIGCALSHHNLWRQLANSNDDSYLIFEDDVTLADNFKEKLSHAYAQVENNDFDILYFAFIIYNNKLDTMRDVIQSNNYPKVIPFDTNFYGAGNGSYIITKSGAKKLLQYVEQNGFNVPCDSIARLLPNVNRYSTIPHICDAPYVGPFSDNKDTDIQRDNKQPKSDQNIFYSQQGEDCYIYNNYINCKRNDGTFVELGGMDGITYSNTKFFEDTLDFNGVLIEPTEQYTKMVNNRPNCKCYKYAINTEEKDVEFVGTYATAGLVETMASSFRDYHHKNKNRNTYKVPGVPIKNLTKELKFIDLFSIDVEGGELVVLETVDWSIPIYIIVIELDGQNKVKDDKCREILKSQGFTYDITMGGNEFWVNKNYFRKNLLFDKNSKKEVSNISEYGKFLFLENHLKDEVNQKILQRNKQPMVNVCTVENYHNGQPARFETYENGHISKLIRKGQVWEPHLHRVFEKYIKPNDVVIEAGCHIGTHTIKLSKLSNKVYAFEPLPSSHSILSTNLQLNKCTNVTLINKGVSNKPGTTKFGWVPDDNPGGAGLDDNPMGAPNWVTSPKKDIAVELTTIDSLNLEKLDFMKIDVEGYELRVIEGAINTIKKCRPTIVLECWSNHSGGVSLEHTSSLFKILLDIGYNIAHIQGPDFIFLP